jgi:hypothetical protein
MSPVDSIRPPKRTKKPTPLSYASVPAKTVPVQKMPKPAIDVVQKPAAGQTAPMTAQKQKTVITAVTIIMALIFIGWVALFMGGKLTHTSTSSFSSSLTNQIRNLWQTVKTDILKIKNQNLNAATNVNDEQIKKLENSVFPQFNDPTKQ